MNVTATVLAVVAQEDAVEVAEVDLVEVEAVEVGLIVELATLEEPEPDPEIAISAQVRYIWPVWKEFHLSDSRV